ncbi:TorA maturation chaperone TorD [Desulfitobacterium sp. LBE]|uniref:TorD/DmsD family molecular chaperone n=1 Tax=Desulfitobacterium sp. LBE TaxID=884086 RepID=UPI00119A17B7|nr:molecular chaperone TorD family protein [Desulfitobacterium sp. LBE]TWH58526.1 TorA maturation chaperone TorD [Desulfitobacterium sp. LBE]
MKLSWEEVCSLRTNLYGFLGNCLLESVPEEGSVSMQWEFWDEFPLESANPQMKDGLSRIISCTEYLAKLPRSQASQEVQLEFMDLFLGPGQPKAPPWESVYRTPERLLFGWPTQEVRKIYGKAGFEISRKNQLPEDHLGLELMFLAMASDTLARLITGKGSKNKIFEMIKLQRDFISSHPLTWIADFHEDAYTKGTIGFYSGLIQLIWGILLWDLDLLEEVGRNVQPGPLCTGEGGRI